MRGAGPVVSSARRRLGSHGPLGSLSLLALALACASLEGESPLTSWVGGPEDEACVACHAEEAAELRWSRHHAGPAATPACLSCHAPHAPLEDGGLGPAPLRASCGSCHREVAAEFALPFRHPLGATVGCTSCHPPHGAPRLELLEETRHGACVECHIELRGPFTYPHEGSERLLCMSCHEPHGSPNRRLLTHASERLLCFSCHGLLEIIHTQTPGSVFTQCVVCHTEVHGSNWSRELFR